MGRTFKFYSLSQCSRGFRFVLFLFFYKNEVWRMQSQRKEDRLYPGPLSKAAALTTLLPCLQHFFFSPGRVWALRRNSAAPRPLPPWGTGLVVVAVVVHRKQWETSLLGTPWSFCRWGQPWCGVVRAENLGRWIHWMNLSSHWSVWPPQVPF